MRRRLRFPRYAGLLVTASFLLFGNVARADPAADGFAEHFHADEHSYIVLEDPLPQIKRLLTSPLLRQAMARGPLADLAKGLGDGGPDAADPLALWTWVRERSRWIPQQVAVAISDNGAADVDHFFRIMALMELIHAATTGDADAHPALRDELKALRRLAAGELKQLHLPRMRIYVRFRAPEDALALLDMLRQEIKEIDPKDLPDFLKIDSVDRQVMAKFVMADQFENDDQIAAFLRDLRLADPDDAEVTQQMIAAVKDLRAEATLRCVGPALVLTLGPVDAGGPAGLPPRLTGLPADIGRIDRDTVLWGRWDGRKIKEVARGWLTLHEQWAKSEAYAHLEASRHGEPVIDVLRAGALHISRIPDVGAARLWADRIDGSIRVAMRGERMPIVGDLAKSPIAQFIPADAEGYSADMTRGLGEALSDLLAEIETPGRMSARMLLPRTNIFGHEADNAGLGYFNEYAGLRDLLHKTARDRFEPGFIAVFGTQGKVDRLEASFELNGVSTRFSARNLPAIEFALVGRPKAPADEDAMKKYVEEVYASMGQGMHNAATPVQPVGRPVVPPHPQATGIDLGLGVPTWGFDTVGLQRSTGEAKVRIDIAGDVQPHFVFVDGSLIFSTSARLTKSLLAAHAGSAPRMMLPKEDDRSMVSAGKMPGETLAKAAEHAGAWYIACLDHIDRAGRGPVEPAEREAAVELFGVFAQVLRLVDHAEWQTSQTQGQPAAHITHGTIHFVGEK